ncbi:MAG: DUF433 domain-containing protein [Candidatus Eremiobacteraeota bacterium]|nr:DUF433 domain-containing protein [Candidatus Eremiobacteraeota bacterium]
MSKFHNEFGYYADGVGPETVVAPEGWQHRRVALTTRTLQGTEVRGWCLETHDLLISKYVAGRPKDLEYCSAVIRLAKAEKDLLLNRLKVITASDDILSGTPVFAGERVPVRTLIDYIEEGHSIADLLVDFPTVAKDNVIQVLAMLKDDLQRHAARS